MAWFADLAGKAEHLLNNLDEQTGAALRNHNVIRSKKHDKTEIVNYAGLSEPPAWQRVQKRQPRSPTRKQNSIIEVRANSPPKRLVSPARTLNYNSKAIQLEYLKDPPSRLRKSPTRKSNYSNYDLNHCPRTLVGDEILKEEGDIFMDQCGLKKRRFSLPEDLEGLYEESFSTKVQNLEVENSMLKNELNVMNKEVSDLLDRLRKTEDDLNEAYAKVTATDNLNNNLNDENNTLQKQIEQLKQKVEALASLEISKFKESNQALESDLQKLKVSNEELVDKIKHIETKNTATSVKLENDLRHAQAYINDLQNDLEKSKNECHRLEKDWEAYKLRVKCMLQNKDKEIKSFQEGINYSADTKLLIDQLENLREEREELSEAVTKVRMQCDDMKQHIDQMESRAIASERLVTALREALREERLTNNKADADCAAAKKELKRIQTETNQTLANLRAQLQDKQIELNSLKEITTSSVNTTDSSALNVADYDVLQESIANDKIQLLTHTLVGKQGKIDSLLADNNILRIQLDKLQTKLKVEMAHKNNHHSVVNVDSDDSALNRVSLRIGLFLRRNPLFRIIIIFYMVGLHLWVALVLLTYTPEIHPASKT